MKPGFESTPPESDDGQTWERRAILALVEAQTMCCSISTLAELLMDGADGPTFSIVEAIIACVQRMERAVIPATENPPAAAQPA